MVFGGLLPKPHFGHVLLETFSRLWILDADGVTRGMPIAYFTHRSRAFEPFEQQLLHAALAGSGSALLPIDRPMHFRDLHLPSRAVVLGRPFDPAILPVYDRMR